jgi:hypothetical protein
MNLKKYLESLRLDEDNAAVFRYVSAIFIGAFVAVISQSFGFSPEVNVVVLVCTATAIWLWLKLKVNW